MSKKTKSQQQSEKKAINEAVLLSIRPIYCNLIIAGRKRIEVRKTFPRKLERPFTCYIYCTQGTYKELGDYSDYIYKRRMKVIGEFICNGLMRPFQSLNLMSIESCVSLEDLYLYSNGKTLYGWRISNLKIYDQPKELSEFGIKKAPQSWCYVKKQSSKGGL